MAPVMERGELQQVDMKMQGAAMSSCLTTSLYDLIAMLQDRLSPGAAMPSCLSTTLYDVIVAIQDGLGLDDDAQVVAIVVHLLRSGRLTWLGQTRVPVDPSPHAAMGTRQRISYQVAAEQSWSMGQEEECTLQ